MIKKNSLLTGLLAGLLVPVLGYFLIFGLLQGLTILRDSAVISENFRERTLFLVSICFNLIPLQVFQIRRWPESVRGVVLVTGLYALTWFILFGRQLL